MIQQYKHVCSYIYWLCFLLCKESKFTCKKTFYRIKSIIFQNTLFTEKKKENNILKTNKAEKLTSKINRFLYCMFYWIWILFLVSFEFSPRKVLFQKFYNIITKNSLSFPVSVWQNYTSNVVGWLVYSEIWCNCKRTFFCLRWSFKNKKNRNCKNFNPNLL